MAVRRGSVEGPVRTTTYGSVGTTRDMLNIELPDWHKDAVCAQTSPEAFFPQKGGSTKDAKRMCNSCLSRIPCLKFALENDERFGIWGGLSERERRKLAKDLRRRAEAPAA